METAQQESTNVRQNANSAFPVSSKAQIYVQSLLAGLCVALFSSAVEELVGEAHVHVSWISAADQVVAGIVAAACVFAIRRNSRKRRMLDRQRFELIAASTQQIRDALQLITDTAVPGSEQQRIVIYAVDHIEWVLQEVLPTVHQEPEEVRARIKAQE
jgi:tRNA threonylcarbamoyladenosine modification (KEOPS) complex Cgi121 subunit